MQEVGADDGFDPFAALGEFVALEVRRWYGLMPVDYEPAGMYHDLPARPSIAGADEGEWHEWHSGICREAEGAIIKAGEQLRCGIAGALRADEEGAAGPDLLLHDLHAARAVCGILALHRHIEFRKQIAEHRPLEHFGLAEKLEVVGYRGTCYHSIEQRAVIADIDILPIRVDKLSAPDLEPDAPEPERHTRQPGRSEVSEADDAVAARQHGEDQHGKQDEA